MELPRRFEAGPPRRILIAGNLGSGRRALAAELAQRFGLAAIDMEAERFGQSGNADTWRDFVAGRIKAQAWAIATADFDTLDLSVQRADWLVWLDFPVRTCVAALAGRAFRGPQARGRFGKGGDGTLLAQIRRVIAYAPRAAPKMTGIIERERRNRTIFILRSRREVRGFVEGLAG